MRGRRAEQRSPASEGGGRDGLGRARESGVASRWTVRLREKIWLINPTGMSSSPLERKLGFNRTCSLYVSLHYFFFFLKRCGITWYLISQIRDQDAFGFVFPIKRYSVQCHIVSPKRL
jgi:hypothetical protein